MAQVEKMKETAAGQVKGLVSFLAVTYAKAEACYSCGKKGPFELSFFVLRLSRGKR